RPWKSSMRGGTMSVRRLRWKRWCVRSTRAAPTSDGGAGGLSLTEQRHGGHLDVCADAVCAGGMPPPPGRVPGDVDSHLYHDVGLHQVHVEGALSAPPRAERPPFPGVRGRGWGDQLGEGAACCLGEG